ncbi:MAG TPA: hypothetical protein VML54_13665, partial [Candidatus Limnocylindrales bacterium]|nr:hypothetical protein [Candidatus Limnocylindrales bacterium]
MSTTVLFPAVALSPSREADRAARVFIAATLVGLLRFHPSFLPTVLSVYWADATLIGLGVL